MGSAQPCLSNKFNLNNQLRIQQVHKEILMGEKPHFAFGIRRFEPDVFPYKETISDYRQLFRIQMQALRMNTRFPPELLPPLLADYDIALIPSMLGAEMRIPEGTPPYVVPMINDIHMIDDLEVPSLDQGLMPEVTRALDWFKKKAPDGTPICLPYQQCPLQLAVILRGGAFYSDLYEDPERAHRLLNICTQTFILCEKHLKNVIKQPLDQMVSFRGIFVPGLRIADDCIVNLSPEMIEEFDVPYLKKVAAEFGNRLLLHFCTTESSRGTHVMKVLKDHKEVMAIDSKYPTIRQWLEEKEMREHFPLVITWREYDNKESFSKKLKIISKYSWGKGRDKGIIFTVVVSSDDQAREALECVESLRDKNFLPSSPFS